MNVNNSVSPMNALGTRNHMQIVGQKRAELLAARSTTHDVGNQQPGRFASIQNNQPVSSTGQPSNPGRQATIEGLMEAWGENGSKYDLDHDGTVGMSDLITLLQRLSGEPKGQPPTTVAKLETVLEPGPPLIVPEEDDGVTTTPTPPAPGTDAAAPVTPEDGGGTNPGLTVDGLLAAWGQKDSQYDFDGNGVVGMADLTALLARLGDTGNPSPVEPALIASTSNGPAARTGPFVDDPETPRTFEPPSLKGLLDAWGEKGSRYDMDGDGIVGMGDLMAMLTRMSEDNDQPGTGNRVARGPIPSIVGRPDTAEDVLTRLQTRFPGGLGIDLRG